MIRAILFSVVATLVSFPASAETFTVITPKGGMVERSRSVSSGEVNRNVERTGPSGRTTSREISLERTGNGQATRKVTDTGPNGGTRIRSQVISRQ